MKIFVCKKCQKYCYVAAGMISECCKSSIFLPVQSKNKKAKVNPAI